MVVSGHSPREAIAQTLALAKAAETWGYHRYWLAEHHGMQGLADTCPEVLLAAVGAATSRIRIGSGGIMLPYYAPFKVASQFMMLEALYPGRVDLGLGRAPGGDRVAAQAVSGGHYDSGANFAEQVAALQQCLRCDTPQVLLQPAGDTQPHIWMLGSSDYGAALAAQLGLPFTFAHFITAQGGDHVTHAYRAEYRASSEHPKPYCALAVFVICADTETEATALSRAVDLRRLNMAYGINTPIPTVAEADARQYTARDQLIIEQARSRSIIGTPAQVKPRLEALATQYQADELIVLTVCASYAARLRSYELLAQLWH
jgi:luciferase family oxidoreductase group 1